MVKTIIKPFILLLGMILIFSYTIAETNAQIREIRQPRKVSDYLSGLDLERFNRLWREGLIHHGNVQAFIDEWADAPDRARAFEHAAGRVLHKSFWKNVGKDVAGIWEGIKDPRLGSDVVREYLEGHAQKYGAWAPFTGAAGIAWSAVTTPFRAAKDIGEVAFTKRTWADIEHPLKTLIGAALAILVGSAVLRQLAKGATKAGKFRRASGFDASDNRLDRVSQCTVLREDDIMHSDSIQGTLHDVHFWDNQNGLGVGESGLMFITAGRLECYFRIYKRINLLVMIIHLPYFFNKQDLRKSDERALEMRRFL